MTKLMDKPAQNATEHTIDPQYLLDDAAVVKFIIDGY